MVLKAFGRLECPGRIRGWGPFLNLREFSMSDVAVPAGRRWTHIAVWIVRGLLALAFLGAGGAKLYGVPMMVDAAGATWA